jgi:hypothetical protein
MSEQRWQVTTTAHSFIIYLETARIRIHCCYYSTAWIRVGELLATVSAA